MSRLSRIPRRFNPQNACLVADGDGWHIQMADTATVLECAILMSAFDLGCYVTNDGHFRLTGPETHMPSPKAILDELSRDHVGNVYQMPVRRFGAAFAGRPS